MFFSMRDIMVLLSSFVLPSENKDRKNSAISKIRSY
ncbi:hypothetical protein BACOVA_01168 [Bacteroides ovatus ATCC 8483]|uniref:Uncharacterized protein n=1 Tax=Bacteroides ovatus (strain ATCC 8483 / DSM 1896 / JCM 5824 / BCRC 10623 / CCUG 4943 / NCTC 11153) TaxID=411476 RepID=A0AAN3AAS3_BACO1|nr:hypothetical protein BACOVA_01168 [Bacteroides ovatus ATCC 8483]